MSNLSNSGRYPGLYDFARKKVYPLRVDSDFMVGRSRSANLVLDDPHCSRKQFQLYCREGVWLLNPISHNSPTFLNSGKITKPEAINHCDLILVGNSRFAFIARKDANLKETILKKRRPPARETVENDVMTVLQVRGAEPTSVLNSIDHIIPLSGQIILGRDPERTDVALPHAQVSRRHTLISPGDKSAIVTDLNSANGTYVNGKRIAKATMIRRGDRLDIGPFALTYDGQSLLPQTRSDNVELACRNLTKVVKNNRGETTLTILDDINLVIRPREFVCILGPSGSGKSTLLSALSARRPAEGSVTINGEELYENFEMFKRDVAVVPQKDVMHDYLKLRVALEYTAKLRLPPDLSRDEIDDTVSDMLKRMGLSERADTRIKDLSGGQIKRASLANEIVSKPSLLFLDEVTSGLDDQTDAEMMRLFRQIADDGKTVVCVTHNLTYVTENCHRVIVLTRGGKLAFIGSPQEACDYFEVNRLGGIYERLNRLEPEEWRSRFARERRYQEGVLGHLDITDSLRRKSSSRSFTLSIPDQFAIFFRQSRLLTLRYLTIMIADSKSLIMMFGQCGLVGLLIVILFGDVSEKELPMEAADTAQIMFLMSISVLWFGCNNSAKEIVKEREIFERERAVNVMASSYLGSKLLLLLAVSILQVILLFLIVVQGTAIDSGIATLPLLLALSVYGVTLGLLISSTSQSTDMAVTIVPIVLIPQIILSGSIASVEGTALLLAKTFIGSYWGYGALEAALPERLLLADYKDWTILEPFLVISLHAILFLVSSLTVLVLTKSKEASYVDELEKWLLMGKVGINETIKAVRNWGQDSHEIAEVD